MNSFGSSLSGVAPIPYTNGGLTLAQYAVQTDLALLEAGGGGGVQEVTQAELDVVIAKADGNENDILELQQQQVSFTKIVYDELLPPLGQLVGLSFSHNNDNVRYTMAGQTTINVTSGVYSIEISGFVSEESKQEAVLELEFHSDTDGLLKTISLTTASQNGSDQIMAFYYSTFLNLIATETYHMVLVDVTNVSRFEMAIVFKTMNVVSYVPNNENFAQVDLTLYRLKLDSYSANEIDAFQLLKADLVHTHAIADVLLLQQTLDDKATSIHTHISIQSPNFLSRMTFDDGIGATINVETGAFLSIYENGLLSIQDAASLTMHTKIKFDTLTFPDLSSMVVNPEDVTSKDYVDMQLLLKSDLVHAHAIADVTLLQTTLDGKAATVHDHVQIASPDSQQVLLMQNVSGMTLQTFGIGSGCSFDLDGVVVMSMLKNAITSKVLQFYDSVTFADPVAMISNDYHLATKAYVDSVGGGGGGGSSTTIISPNTLNQVEVSDTTGVSVDLETGAVHRIFEDELLQTQTATELNMRTKILFDPTKFPDPLSMVVNPEDVATKAYVDAQQSGLVHDVQITGQVGGNVLVQHNFNTALEKLSVIPTVLVTSTVLNVPVAIGDKVVIYLANYNGGGSNASYGIDAFVDATVVDPLNSFLIHFNEAGAIVMDVPDDGTYKAVPWTSCDLLLRVSTPFGSGSTLAIDSLTNGTQTAEITGAGEFETVSVGATIQIDDTKLFTVKTAATQSLRIQILDTVPDFFRCNYLFDNHRNTTWSNGTQGNFVEFDSLNDKVDFNTDIYYEGVIIVPPSSREYKDYVYLTDDSKVNEFYDCPRAVTYSYKADFQEARGKKYHGRKLHGWIYEDVQKVLPACCKTRTAKNKKTGKDYEEKYIDFQQTLLQIIDLQAVQIKKLDQRLAVLEDNARPHRKDKRIKLE